MKPSHIAFTASISTIAVLVALVAGGTAIAHRQVDANFRGGCANIDDSHITSHAEELNGWVADELALDTAQRANLGQWLSHGGRGVSLDQGQHLGPMLFDGLFDLPGVEHGTPSRFD